MNHSLLNSSFPTYRTVHDPIEPQHDYSFVGNGTANANSSWTFRSYFNLVTKVLAMITNSTLVYLFIRYRSVRTPFNVYAVSLCLANLAYLLLFYPTSMYNEWRSSSSRPSQFLCVFHRFTVHGFSPVIAHSHFLIAVNRLWAVVAPISYRNYHRPDSILRPSLICLFIWVYVELFVLPTVIIDAQTPAYSSEKVHCTAKSRGPDWYVVTGMFLIYDVPLVLCLLTYPVIFAIILHNARVRLGQAASQEPTEKIPATNATTSQANTTPIKTSCYGRLRHHSGKQFFMLTLLTLNVAISLFPAQLYYSLITFGVNPSGMFTVVGTLYALGCIFDPILFIISVKTFKAAFKKMFEFRK